MWTYLKNPGGGALVLVLPSPLDGGTRPPPNRLPPELEEGEVEGSNFGAEVCALLIVPVGRPEPRLVNPASMGVGVEKRLESKESDMFPNPVDSFGSFPSAFEG
jgi:hypothetical protein